MEQSQASSTMTSIGVGSTESRFRMDASRLSRRIVMRFRLLVLILVGASAAFAGNLPVNNPSFENTSLTPLTYSCGTNCLYSHGVTQWSTQGATGILQPGTPYPNALFNYVPNGQNVAYIDGGTVTPGRIYQYVALTAVPGVAYTLKVDFGWA